MSIFFQASAFLANYFTSCASIIYEVIVNEKTVTVVWEMIKNEAKEILCT